MLDFQISKDFNISQTKLDVGSFLKLIFFFFFGFLPHNYHFCFIKGYRFSFLFFFSFYLFIYLFGFQRDFWFQNLLWARVKMLCLIWNLDFEDFKINPKTKLGPQMWGFCSHAHPNPFLFLHFWRKCDDVMNDVYENILMHMRVFNYYEKFLLVLWYF